MYAYILLVGLRKSYTYIFRLRAEELPIIWMLLGNHSLYSFILDYYYAFTIDKQKQANQCKIIKNFKNDEIISYRFLKDSDILKF